MHQLPKPTIRTRWIRAEKMPTAKRFGKFSQIIDVCYHSGTGGNVKAENGKWHMTTGKVHSIKVAYVRDHPFMRDTLSGLKHVPRAVRSIYTAEVRLGFNRAIDAFPIVRALDAAYEAWQAYTAPRDNG